MATDGWKARTIAASIAAALGGSKAGRGFICLCPSHADRSPSLSIRDGDDGRLLVHCFSGCDPLDILAAIRTQIGDLGEPVEAAEARQGIERAPPA